ncbi:asparagine synthase-related protein [Saccharopolyspora elongata]|uniref:Asparagine synthase n=1 Tax=Saccharopolyspora elongata TaxID=2530387 RepID=A0A4R4YA31_9PSEU|nr:asparagine synthase-related protein [Saccharopolyspora elongata]TDD41365.1 asparagine synthase [Saccharopolyspora elongata]
MLAMQLHLADLRSPGRWTYRNGRWEYGGSWIATPPVAVLRVFVKHEPTATTLLVRELLTTSSTPPEDSLDQQERTTWPGDYLRIHLTANKAELEAGLYGTAPVYLTATDTALYGSWWLPDLRHRLSADDLCDRAVARLLTRQQPYTTETLFTQVWQLTERARATFTTDGLTMTYPEPATHVLRARDIAAGVDVTAAFEALLADSTATRRTRNPVGVELSGGCDSANVALSVREVHDGPLCSAGVIVDDTAMGRDQQRRRASIAALCGLVDEQINGSAYAPFTPGGIRGRGEPHDVGEFYREAFAAVGSHFAQCGVRVVFTGVGGDELAALRPNEATLPPARAECIPWLGPRSRETVVEDDGGAAPVTVLPRSVLTGSAVHNPDYLAAGMWPVAPLATPALVRFSQQLPVHLRRGKRFLRQRLHRAGLPQSVVHPRRPENFLGLMQKGLRCHGLPLARRLLQTGMLLADTGHIDPAVFAATVDDASTRRHLPTMLCDTLMAELSLRSLLGCPASMSSREFS